MELKYGGISPYARKVLVVAHEVGVFDRMRLTPVNTRDEPEKITLVNPLAKIPVLITDAGVAIYDSPVICEYLDAEFGGHRLLPASGARRWEIMTRVALVDGLLDAALLVRNERLRPAANQSSDWVGLQLRKVNTTLEVLEKEVTQFTGELDMGLVGLGCGLGYIPLRLEEYAGLARWPRLKAWYDTVSRRPSFQSTTPIVPK